MAQTAVCDQNKNKSRVYFEGPLSHALTLVLAFSGRARARELRIFIIDTRGEIGQKESRGRRVACVAGARQQKRLRSGRVPGAGEGGGGEHAKDRITEGRAMSRYQSVSQATE